MATLIKQVRIIDPRTHTDMVDDVLISSENIEIAPSNVKEGYTTINGRNRILTPGLVDLHVHFREPGFTHKENIASGIRAALAGGVTSALVMPNTNPALDTPQSVLFQLKKARTFGFDLMVAAAATKGLLGKEISDIAALKQSGAKAITDDGKPILEDSLMMNVLKACRAHKLVCMQHAEHTGISCGHALNEGKASQRLCIPGQKAQAEYDMVARDIDLAEKLEARYHVLHLSCAQSLKLVARAKKRKALVSCEVTPHHILLSESDIHVADGNKKMNPPLRSKDDRDALLNGINDGVIDAVASDHAPHHRREKLLLFTKAPFGVVGVETSILVLLRLVHEGKISLMRAISLMTDGPAKILQEHERIGTLVGDRALKNAVLIDPNVVFMLNENHMYGRSKNSAFLGMELRGRVLATFLNGEIGYQAGKI
ncbi:MAG: dihydroorotase [Myxococcales bacterium]|nr:dihydroorotase [Myxococcales bacterium]USN50482.1 MAG: dihydroorotase [Myxococcales bacterium]